MSRNVGRVNKNPHFVYLNAEANGHALPFARPGFQGSRPLLSLIPMGLVTTRPRAVSKRERLTGRASTRRLSKVAL